MDTKRMLAADFGASGGRVMAGNFDGNKISISQAHRFSNEPVYLGNTLYWDFPRLLHELKTGLRLALLQESASSIGVDTWGVDFGLLDADGYLLENPVHYRDERTVGMVQEAFQHIDKDRFYEITGNQFMELNTAFQLLSLQKNRPELLKRADKLLPISDLFGYFLTGNACCEYTMASTTQLLDARKKEWSKEVIQKLGLSENIFLPLTMPGSKIGSLSDAVCKELSVPALDVIAVAGHDTQCALTAVPAAEKDFIFISCGTWSLFGTELSTPAINEKSKAYNLTNEGAFGGGCSFLKNIIGLWLIQESRRQWIREGEEYGFGELEAMAAKEACGESFIDPDDIEFVAPGNIPERIQRYCQRTGQKIPMSKGQLVRCIDESLALKYRMTLEEISACTGGKKYHAIHLVGGGAQSGLLCQLTADVCGVPVCAGPVEATVYGNLAIQLSAAGEADGLDQIRSIIRNSEEILIYEPRNTEFWEEKYRYFQEKIVK